MLVSPGHHIIQGEACTEGCSSGALIFINGHEEPEDFHQSRCFFQQTLPLFHGRLGEENFAFFEISQPAMNEFR